MADRVCASDADATIKDRPHCRQTNGSLLNQLRADGEPLHVVERFIAPLLGVLLPGEGELHAKMRVVCEQLAEFTPAVLGAAAKFFQGDRTEWPSAALARKRCNLIKQSIAHARLRIIPGTPQWIAWMNHYRATGRGSWADRCQEPGYDYVETDYPPGYEPPNGPPRQHAEVA